MLWLPESRQLKAEEILRSDRHFERKTASLETISAAYFWNQISLSVTFLLSYHAQIKSTQIQTATKMPETSLDLFLSLSVSLLSNGNKRLMNCTICTSIANWNEPSCLCYYYKLNVHNGLVKRWQFVKLWNIHLSKTFLNPETFNT